MARKKKSRAELDALAEKRKKKKELERARGILERELQDALERNVPLPCADAMYNIGDRVVFGAWDWSAVLETTDYGKVLKLVSVTWRTKMNVPDHGDFRIHWVNWTDVKPYRTHDQIPDERITQDDDIHFNYQNRDVRSLINMYFNRYGIDLDPEYQRGNVWKPEQKRSLIESIFNNVDIGKFAVIHRPWGDNPHKPIREKSYEMLDGKQRLTALVEFFTGRFSYKGMYYNDLHPFDQNHFRNYSVSYAETSPLTREQKYRYFLKLNTNGTPVDPKHLEKVRGMLEQVQAEDAPVDEEEKAILADYLRKKEIRI